MGEKVHQNAQAQHTQPKLQQPNHQGQQNGVGDIRFFANGQLPQFRGDHQRHERDRARRELARRAK